jgi:hypothetical protein
VTEAQGQDEQTSDAGRRDALLKEYGEVVGNFRLLTDIRFKLLALLPIAAAAATAVLSAGGGRDAAAEVRALALSLFGLLVTVALATYNDRNDQLYDRLVGRAASIEWQLGLPDGAFANRPAAWFTVQLPVVRGGWSINHRNPVAWIYGTSVALWLFSVGAAIVQLLWGDDPASRWALAAVLVPAALLPVVAVSRIRRQRQATEERMRLAAADATEQVEMKLLQDDDLAALADHDPFLEACEQLSNVSREVANARVRFYAAVPPTDKRQFMPEEPASLVAAYFVALIADLPAEWIDDCARQRRRPLPNGGQPR